MAIDPSGFFFVVTELYTERFYSVLIMNLPELYTVTDQNASTGTLLDTVKHCWPLASQYYDHYL